jgi:hypothetical protein
MPSKKKGVLDGLEIMTSLSSIQDNHPKGDLQDGY